MKSNYWTLCCIALLCIVSANSWKYFAADNDFLKEDSDGEFIENDFRQVKQMGVSKSLPKDQTNKVSHFYEEQRSEEKCIGYCLNDGICSIMNEYPYCTCKVQFDGYRCENVMCPDNYCLNGGTCSVDTAINVCSCLPEFEGERCQSYKCKDYCKNGGTCTVDAASGDMFCDCTAQFTGATCETDRCAGYCENTGSCNVDRNTGERVCTCPPQYEGLKCEVDKCQGYCMNEGSCDVDWNTGNLVCKCPPRFGGYKCENDRCKGFCKNNGTCNVNETTGALSCSCRKRFDGPYCEIDRCEGLCKNNGWCYVVESTGAVSCLCQERFAGDTCEIDRCTGYCKNGGYCDVDHMGNLYCKCPPRFEGPTCEMEADICKEKCGTSDDVVCRGDRTDIDKITCSCKKNKIFHDKDCKEDLCLKKCGLRYGTANPSLNCTGDGVNKAVCECAKPNTTSFDERDKKCKTDYCKTVCGDAMCEEKFKKKTVKDCVCEEEFEAFHPRYKTCKFDFCFENCGAGYNTAGTGVVCKGDKFNEEAKCSCKDTKKTFFEKQCKKQCFTEKDCKNLAHCDDYGDSKFCSCHDGTEGDMCEDITACKTGDLKECTGTRGKCVFDEDTLTAKCDCTKFKGTVFYEKVGYCEVKCTYNKQCKDGKICNVDDEFCTCREGMGGNGCKEVLECKKELGKICINADAKCVFDEDSPHKASCQCNKKNFVYNNERKKCEDPFCRWNRCQDDSTCSFNTATETGLCICKEDKYYNYQTNTCEVPDNELKCLLKKTPCGKNEVCKDGVCVCAENYERKEEGQPCEANFCESDHCFNDGECDKKDGFCTCGYHKYYDGEGCKEARCVWKDFKKDCLCPDRMTRDTTGGCKPEIEGEKLCSKDCGYGFCIEEDEGEENITTCRCMSFAEYDSYKGTCILDVSVCASKKLTKDFKKCECTAKYKQAKDGITCELVTCADQRAQQECAAAGGECKMRWKNTDGKEPGYYCKCPKGFMDTEKGICTDVCSLSEYITTCTAMDRFCYNSLFDREGKPTSSCQCPPPLKTSSDGKCSEIAEHVYMIKNIPVLKKRYELKTGINTVLLNADIILSLAQTYSRFDYGYLYDYEVDGNVLKCSAWVNFKEDPKADFELDRVKTRAIQFLKKPCYGCDPYALVWPPHLMLSGDLRKVSIEALRFCSYEVKNTLCGKHALCDEKTKKCSCPEGFRTLAFSIRERANYRTQSCEDIDECTEGSASCSRNTTCVNIPGEYRCDCKPGYKRENSATYKDDCFDLCTPSPCKKGTCSMKNNMFNCQCEAGASGSLCDRKDVNYETSRRTTVVVGVVLGTFFGVAVIAFIWHYRRMRRNSDSRENLRILHSASNHDFVEMRDRRHMKATRDDFK